MLIEYKVKTLCLLKMKLFFQWCQTKIESVRYHPFQIENMAVLKTAAIFGANASENQISLNLLALIIF